jgi:rubrerythrin
MIVLNIIEQRILGEFIHRLAREVEIKTATRKISLEKAIEIELEALWSIERAREMNLEELKKEQDEILGKEKLWICYRCNTTGYTRVRDGEKLKICPKCGCEKGFDFRG